jgi:hypothetical protein
MIAADGHGGAGLTAVRMGRHEVPEKISSQDRSNDLLDGRDSDAVLVGVKIGAGVRDSVVFRV